MNKKNWALFTLSIMGSSLAFAQSGKDSIVKQLDQVEVTATKYPIKQSQTGKVVTIISHEEIERSVGKSLGQLLTEQAGINVIGSFNAPGKDQTVSIRGGGSGRTLVLVDGVPVYDPSQPDNTFDINLIPTVMIERIEIMKGAQSTLYGSDAVAGVINIITIKPNVNNPFNAKAMVSGGNLHSGNGAAQLYGKIADQLTYNVRYNHSFTSGFSAAYDSSKHVPGSVPFDNDAYHSDNVATNLGWAATKALTVKGFFQYSRYNNDIDNGAFLDARAYNNNNKSLMLGGGFTYALPSTTIHGTYMYTTTDRLAKDDSTIDHYYVHDDFFGKSQYVELYASSDLGYHFTWLNGADYRYSSMNENGVYGSSPSTFKDTSVSQTSMYSSLAYNGPSGLNVELGGRLNTHSRYGSNYTYTFNPSWLINSNWKVYGTIASSFKAPTLYQLYANYYGNPTLQPEKSTTYEGGVQYSSPIIESRATWFHRKTKDALALNFIDYVYFNQAEEQGQGIEWENKIRIDKFVTFSFNYTWLKLKQVAQSRVTDDDSTYNYGLRQPEHTINATLAVQPIKALYLSVSGHYESKRYDVGGYNPNTYTDYPDVVLNSFFILNAYGEYHICKKAKLFADAKNLFNKKFFTIYGYNSIPRMFIGGVTFEL